MLVADPSVLEQGCIRPVYIRYILEEQDISVVVTSKAQDVVGLVFGRLVKVDLGNGGRVAC